MDETRRLRNPWTARVVLAAALVGVVLAFATMAIRHAGKPSATAPDYDGSGHGSLLLKVADGDTVSTVGDHLVDLGAVKSTRAFVKAATGTAVENIQPGFYQVKGHASGSATVADLRDARNRVGLVDIKPGQRLRDTDVIGGQPEKGIYSLVAAATCLRDLDNPNNPPKCHSEQEIEQIAATTPPDQLGVPAWALPRVASAPDPTRRLEGLVVGGVHNIDPTADPKAILTKLITESAQQYDSTGLPTAGQGGGLDPYDTLVAASLVEREGRDPDFPKVARVILNRLAKPMRLQFDSTVNYTVASQAVATTDADRDNPTPWNTYAKDGLPVGPIDSPSIAAIQAVEHPADGDWLYFVTVDKQGTTLFTSDYQQHLDNQRQAVRNGVLSGGN